MIKIKQGLNLPITGSPEDRVSDPITTRSVGLLGGDYLGLKPKVLISPGEFVKIGQPLFHDKNNPGVPFTSPASGVVQSINRGARRSLQSIVIDVEEGEKISFKPLSQKEVELSDSAEIRGRIIDSGVWTSFKTRPFSKIPSINSNPSAIFVNAMDTNPLSVNPEIILEIKKDSFGPLPEVAHLR